VLETYRQALRDVFDMPALKELLQDIRMRKVSVREVETASASPFARSLVFAYVAAYMYEQDSPIAERRAQALTLDRNLLSELLGQAELRELIDPQVLAELEEELQHLTEERKARDADQLHDLLRRLGDLAPEEIEARCLQDPASWLRQLERERRAAEIRVAGQTRWIAAEDAGLYRDALGALPPPGLPVSFLETAENPLPQIVRRFARHHGPFLIKDVARRYDLRIAQVEPVLRELEREGTLVRGEIRPGGTELDDCDAEILRRLKRRTLARLRHEVAPVDARTLGLFLPQWHGVGSEEQGTERLLQAVSQLEGVPLPWSELSEVILPRRVARFTLQQLDMLCASGALIWVGRGPLGPRDSRVALYLREHAGELLDPPDGEEPRSELHAAILHALERQGASFLKEIEQAVRRERPGATADEIKSALWDLVWAGRITNDTFGPLQTMRWPRRSFSRRRPRRPSVAGGRWWRVENVLAPDAGDTQRTLARARLLLERYGVVSREAAQAEELHGGFSPVYKVLTAMEDSGQIRRGYFVEGLAGAQFAHVGAVDRLRASRPDEEGDETWTEEDVVILSAIDPANPYGALLPWPERAESAEGEGARPRRVAGASVLLLGGHPVIYVAPNGRQILTFPFPGRPAEEILPIAVPALRRVPRRLGRRRLHIEEIDGLPADGSPHLEVMRRCGFERGYRGLVDVKV
jgi:ATP-dependent Lhr-like helicase